MGAEKNNRLDAEFELQHLMIRRKDEEDRLGALCDKVTREKEREEGIQRSIAEKQLVLKSLQLERERLEDDIRREQDHYDEVRKDKNGLIRDLAQLEENQRVQLKEIKESQELLRDLKGKLEEVTGVLRSVEDEIVLKLKDEKESSQKVLHLKADISLQEENLQRLKDECRRMGEVLVQEKGSLKLVQDQVSEESYKEKTLKHLNEELRLELMRVEGKLADRRNSFNQLEFDSQEVGRKIQDLQRDIEAKERSIQDQKRQILKGEENLRDLERNLKDFRDQSQREKKNSAEDFQQDKARREAELQKLQDTIQELEDSRRDIASLLDTERERIKDVSSKSARLKEAKELQEEELSALKVKRDEITEHIHRLKEENESLQKKKSDLEYEVSLFNIKYLDNEAKFQEQERDARLELESLRRSERAKVSQERDAMLAEVEALKKKALADVETNSDGVLEKARAEADALIAKARLFEQDVMTKSQARLREANEEAQRRDKLTFERFEEAEKNLAVLHQEYDEKREKVRQHLQALTEKGERHLRGLRESQENKLKREEKYFLQRLDQQKRREYKRVASVRNEELAKKEENIKVIQKEIQEKKIAELQKLSRLKEKVHQELESEREKQLQEINQTKKTVLEQLRDSRREKESRFEEDMKRERENFERTKKERVSHAVSAVFHLVLAHKRGDGQGGQDDDVLKKNIHEAIALALNGEYHQTQEKSEIILDSNPLEKKRIFQVIGKYSLRFGLPAAMVTFIALDAGGVRSRVLREVSGLIKQQKSAQDIFVKNQHEEWKQKYTFNPEQTSDYKKTYTDNVLYTKDFVTVMEKEEFQNNWILALHEFIVKELELSEEVAINYISAEGTMIKEMETLRKDINPQFLDQGINKLREIENKFESDVTAKISDPAKYERFKEFRKSYYEDFVKGRAVASRP